MLHIFAYLSLFLAAFISIANADYDVNPEPIAGWVHDDSFSKDTPLKHGVVLTGGDVQYSSPVVAEIDGDTSNGLETVVATANGYINVVKANGQVLWSAALPIRSCAVTDSNNRIYSSPAVGALYGDGVPYVVAGYGGIGGKKCDGGVMAYRGSDGKVAWKFSTLAFAKKAHFGANIRGVYSSPAIADVDGDGKMEIGFGSFDRNVYLLNYNGKVRWYYNAADTVWSSPAFADADGDGKLELIIGTDISQNKKIDPPTSNGGNLYAIKTDKRKNPHINFRDKNAILWMKSFDQVLFSSPVIADVVPESEGNEVIIASGCYFPEKNKNKTGKWIKIVKISDGTVLQTLNTGVCSSSAPAIGDIDGDGVLEIVATVNGSTSLGGTGRSHLMAFKASSSEPIWSVIPYDRGANDPYGGTLMSPVIADLDGNGSLEVIVANYEAVHIFAGADGSALTCQEKTCDSNPLTLYAWKALRSTPAVADVNLDGKLDIIIGGGHRYSGGHGMLWGWTGFDTVLSSQSGTLPALSTPWPMWRKNSQHTGVYN